MSAIGTLRALGALIQVTVREALRQRLWLAVVVATLVLVFAILQVRAVDQSDRLRLAVTVISGGLGFVGMLGAMLIASAQVRRDLDARLATMLFSKPLARATYLLGRFAGVLVVLTVGLGLMALAAGLTMQAHFRAAPAMREAIAPSAWSQIAATGERLPIESGRTSLLLAGLIGGGVQVQLDGVGDADRELLVRMDVRSVDSGLDRDRCAVQVLASADGVHWLPVALDPHSPYGQDPDDPTRVLLRARDSACRDLAMDYARLVLPDAAVAHGQTSVRVLRLDQGATLVAGREGSILLAHDGGSFLANLERGVLVVLAQAAVLCAFTMLIATVAGLPVALLGGLALYFAGNALWALRDTLLYDAPGQALARLVHLALLVLPDFDRAGVAGHLAGSRAVTWGAVGDAWCYFGVYTVLFLVLAYVGLRRREL